MADETVVSTTFTADTAQLETALGDILARLGTLEGAAKAGGEGLTMMGAGGKAGAEGLGATKVEAVGLMGALEGVGTHVRTVTMGLDAMGLEGAAAAVKVDGLLEALKGFAAAAPELLVIGAAITAAFMAFSQIKDAIASAGAWEQKMAVLGATVSASGGNWKVLSKDVADYAELQERTTIYSRDQVVTAMLQLTSAGMGVADAMKVNRIAEDASAATGQSLVTVNHALVEAMHGRTQALTMLGIGTKQSIKDGMSFHDILSAIEKQMGGSAAAAANTYLGSMTQLGNALDTLREKVGAEFTPALTAMARKLLELVESDGPAVIAFAHNLEASFAYVGHELRAEVVPAFDDLLKAFAPSIAGFHDLTDSITGGQTGWQDLHQFIEQTAQAIHDVTEFIANNKDLFIEFFDVVIGLKAVTAVRALTSSFVTLKGATIATDAIAASTLLWEAFAGALMGGGGVVGAVRALATGLYDLVPAEAAATLGLSLLVVGVVDLATHWTRTTDSMKSDWREAVAEIQDGVANVETGLAALDKGEADLLSLFGKVSQAARDNADALNADAAALDKNAAAARNAAKAQRDLNAAKNPGSDTSQADFNNQENWSSDPSTWQYHPDANNAPNIDTQYNPMVGGGHHGKKKAHHAGPSFKFNDIPDDLSNKVAGIDRYLASIKKLDETLKSAPHTIADYQEAIAKLHPVINEDTYLQAQLTTKVKEARASHEDAIKTYNEYGNSLRGAKPTAGQLQALQDLKNDVSDTRKTYDQLHVSLGKVAADLQTQEKLSRDAAKAIAGLSDAWSTFTQNEADRMKEDLATFNMTNQEKIAYYQQLANSIDVIDKASLAKREAYQKQADNAELAEAKARYNTETKYVTTFLDDIIVQHKSFKDIFKSIWDDIVKIFIADMTKMIVEGQLFQKLFVSLTGGGGSTGGGFNPLSLLGLGGAGSGTQAIGTSSNPMFVEGTSSYNLAMTGSTTGVSPFQQGGNLIIAGGGGGSVSMLTMQGLESQNATNGGYGAFLSQAGGRSGLSSMGSGAFLSHLMHDGTIGKGTVGSLVLGIEAGQLFGSMMGGGSHSTWGSVGGAVGSLFGPVGSMAGAALGSLFGHADNPATMPDKYNTGVWGQFAADYNNDNNVTANGQQFHVDSTTNSSTGGKGIGQYLHDEIAKMTPQQLSQVFGQDSSSITSMFSQWTAQGMHDGKNGNLMIGNSTYDWQQIQKLGDLAMNDLNTNKAAKNIPIYSLMRMAPDFNQGNMGQWGSWSASTGTGTGGVPGASGSTSGTASSLPGWRSPVLPGENPITINVNGNVVGTNGMQELADIVQKTVSKNHYHNFNNSTRQLG